MSTLLSVTPDRELPSKRSVVIPVYVKAHFRGRV